MKTKQQLAAPQRNARGQWIKGVSGNDLGRPRSALAELCREQVTKHGLVNVLGNVAARTGDYSKKSKIPVTVADQIQAHDVAVLLALALTDMNQHASAIDVFDLQPD